MNSQEELEFSYLTIEKFVFSLQKYKLPVEKQVACEQIKRCADKLITWNTTRQKTPTNKELSFIYEHLSEHNEYQWKIWGQQTFQIVYKFIPTICFRQTYDINISQCSITNIEALAYLRAPRLLTIELYGNHLTSIKPLVKNKELPQLRNLTLYRNKIVNSEMLQRSKFDYLNYLELDINPIDNVFCQDLTFIYKLPIKRSGQKVIIWYDEANRIMRPIENYFKRFNEIKRR